MKRFVPCFFFKENSLEMELKTRFERQIVHTKDDLENSEYILSLPPLATSLNHDKRENGTFYFQKKYSFTSGLSHSTISP